MTTQLICPECQRENEAERIFCHGCGARLDRSTLVSQKPRREKPEQARQRLQRLLDPQRGKLRRLFFTFSKVVLGAAAAAVLLEVFLPPNLPPVVQRVGAPREINFDLEKMTASHQPGQVQYTQDQVNAYLTYALKSKQASLDKPLLTFKRIIVELGENTCSIAVERSFFGYSLFQRASYQVRLNDGKISTSHKGGWLGRLPIHPAAMPFVDALFADVWSALGRERKLVANMGGIELHDGSVTLVTPPQ
jgi:hypothetical protein